MSSPDLSKPLAATAPAPRDRAPGAGWGVAIAATLGMSVSYIDRQTLAAIAPAVRSSLAIDHTQFGWLLSGFSVAYLVGAPAAGVVVDKLGARRGFAVAVVVWSLVAGAHAFASSFAVLFALRVLLGAAEAPSFPAAAQAIRRSLPGARRPAAYGLLFSGSSLGAMVAAPLAVTLEGRYGFRFAFLGTAVVGTLWIPFWLIMTRRGRIPADEAADALRGAGPEATPSTSRAPEPKEPASARWIDVVRSPPVLRALVAVIGVAPSIMFLLNWTSQYLVERWGLARTDIGGYLVVPPLLFDVGAVGFGWVASTRGEAPRPGSPAGAKRPHSDLLLLATGLAALLSLAPLAPSPSVAMILFGAAACGGGGVYVLVTADMLASVPIGRTSSAGGMTAAAQSLSLIVASPLVGMAVDRTHGYGVAMVMLGLAAVPTSIAFVLWPSMRKR